MNFLRSTPQQPQTTSPFTGIADIQNSDAEKFAIAKILKSRKITALTHFTRAAYVRSILHNGLLSAGALMADPAAHGNITFNPPYVPQPWHKSVSLNISFPDFRLFTEIQQHNPLDWVVLCIDPQILINQPFFFFRERAASLLMNRDFVVNELQTATTSQAFSALFDDHPEVKRERLNIPDSYPTDPKTEIRSFSFIPPEYIREVWFCNDYKYSQWTISNLDFASGCSKKLWFTGLKFFSPRSDYTFWRNPIKIN